MNAETFQSTIDVDHPGEVFTDWLNGASFWQPDYVEPSAWHEHAPFAFWLTSVLRPSLIVELGTHGGFSYFSFCQAVRTIDCLAKCYAIDTWAGDEHAGFYGSDVYDRVKAHNDRHYAAFSRLVRSTFDDALAHFDDGSIDILHIDGRHFYEDVRHDLESWRPKLSDRAVVLFHDTNVRERDFGVFRLWSEIERDHPSFEFMHGHGLGVLGIGQNLDSALTGFFRSAGTPPHDIEIRRAYQRLGEAVRLEASDKQGRAQLASATSKQQTLSQQLEDCRKANNTDLAENAAHVDALQARLTDRAREIDDQVARIGNLETEASSLRDAQATYQQRIDNLDAGLLAGTEELGSSKAQIDHLTVRLAEKDQEVRANGARMEALQSLLDERESSLSANRRELTDRDAAVNTLRTKAAETEKRLKAVYRSRSWKLTKPLRTVRKNARRVNSRIRIAAIDVARFGYRHAPLPIGAKTRIKNRLFKSVPIRSPAAKPRAIKPKLLRAGYRDLLVESLFNPQLNAPYDDRSVYFIAFMASYTRYLVSKYRGRAQSVTVSIVMPTYNRAHCIDDAIRSVLAQSYVNWELMIVDDCGGDETPDVVGSFVDPRIKYRRLESNGGATAARNVALQHVSGDFVCYLDSDNTLEPDFLLVLVNELNDRPDFDIVYCAQRAFQVGPDDREELFIRFAPFHRPSLENRNFIDIGVLMHRRSILDRTGAFNGDMQRLGDWEFLVRQTGEKAAWAVPAVLSNYNYDKANGQITDTKSFGVAQDWVDRAMRTDPIAAKLTDISLDGLELMYSAPYPIKRPTHRRPVSIVIPSYEAAPYLRACVTAIERFSSDYDIELIIADNASGPAVISYLDALADAGSARVIFNERNLGFTFAVNQGIEAARPGNDIIVMNNDAIVTRGWLDALQTVLDDHPNAGLVVPGQVVLGGEKSLPIHQPHRNAARECDVNVSAHHNNVIDPLFDAPKGFMSLDYAPFFCVYIPRSTLDTLGPLDVENGPHYRSDRLYCDMVTEIAGKPIIYTPHSKIYHFVQRATKDLGAKDAKLYKDMFVKNDWTAISTDR